MPRARRVCRSVLIAPRAAPPGDTPLEVSESFRNEFLLTPASSGPWRTDEMVETGDTCGSSGLLLLQLARLRKDSMVAG